MAAPQFTLRYLLLNTASLSLGGAVFAYLGRASGNLYAVLYYLIGVVLPTYGVLGILLWIQRLRGQK